MGLLDGVLGTVGGIVNGGTVGGSVGGSVGGAVNTGGLLGGVLGNGGLVGDLLGTVGGIVGGVTGGGLGGIVGGGGSGGVGGGPVGGGGILDNLLGGVVGGALTNNGLLDGLVDIGLFDEDGLLSLGILPDANGNGLLNLNLLDPNGDGLIDLSLLNGSLGLSVLDQDGDGLIDLNILDTIVIDIDLDQDGVPDDTTNPSDFDTVLTGTAGRDTFRIDSNEKTYVDGLGDLDVATYVQSAADYNYAIAANGVFIFNDDKVDYLQNVERINFTDGTLVLDTDVGESAGIAYRLYQATFDRTPDAGGLAYWMDELWNGKDPLAVSADFIFSVEFQQTYGALSTQDFVETLYENILQRSGEAAGITYWTQQIDSGEFTRAEVLLGFSESEENVELVGQAIANGFFMPDVAAA